MKKHLFKRETFSATAPLQVDEIYIVHKQDDSPDLSFLGEYSSTPGEVHIDREERGDCGRGECRYFNLGCGGADYIEQDYKRMEAYSRGDWYMLGIQVIAVVSYPLGNGSRRLETMESGGLRGIESDSDDSYLAEVEQEELADLRSHLEAFNVPMPDLEPCNA